jgi:hypothetical protein
LVAAAREVNVFVLAMDLNRALDMPSRWAASATVTHSGEPGLA